MKQKKPLRRKSKTNSKRRREAELDYPPLPDKCEACGNTWPLTVAHRHERNWYMKKPHLLTDKKQVMVLCSGGSNLHKGIGGCHTWYDTHKEAREDLFMRLRGNE